MTTTTTKKHTHKATRAVQFCSCGAARVNGGEWDDSGKDPSAVAMGTKAIAMSTPEERAERAAAGGTARWKGTKASERSEYMAQIASRPRVSRRVEDRCECGRYSRERAEKIGHLCGKALEGVLSELQRIQPSVSPPRAESWTADIPRCVGGGH